MVRILKYLASTLFFLMMLVIFLPKTNLYYFALAEANKAGLVISNKSLKESSFGLKIEDVKVFYQGIEAANIGAVDINLYLFYNRVVLHKSKLSSLVENYLPREIDNVVVSYSIINPLEVTFVAQGRFGLASGSLHLDTRVVEISLKPSKIFMKQYKNSLRYLKKSENGEYSYEKSL